MKSLSFKVDLTKRNLMDQEPGWSPLVDRWYQLDEMGFAFCEALHHWNYLREFQKPDVIFLCLEGASNRADQDFVQTGLQSPAKFVYTLPNIAAAVIFQMIQSSGKVYCFSKGGETLSFALKEAQEFSQKGQKIWVLASPARTEEPLKRSIQFYEF